jgi:hypothetical protein
MHRNIFLIGILFLYICLAGCATPPGQFKGEDYTWQEKTYNQNYKILYKNLITGFRTCGGKSTGSIIGANQIGVPDCKQDIEGVDMLCDIYLEQDIGGRSDWVLGIIKIKASTDAFTTIRYGLNASYPKAKSPYYWMQFAEGKYDCELKRLP